RRYSENLIVITSRVVGFEHSMPGVVLEVQPLTTKLIEQFILQWFKTAGKPQIGQNLWVQIRGNSRIMDLAYNPFLLSIMTMIREEGKELPNRRVELYQLCVTTLLELWDEQRGIKRNKFVSSLKEDLLMGVSLYFYEKGERNLLPVREVFRVVADVLNTAGSQCNPKDVLDEIEFNSGLFRKYSFKHYAFAHRTLFEFFTAQGLLIEKDNKIQLTRYFDRYYRETQWNEIFRLATGLLEKPTPFLEHAFDKDPTLAARCYLDAHPNKVDHQLIKQRWTEQIEQQERVKIVQEIQKTIADKQEVLDFIEAIFRTGETDTEVLYHCDDVLRQIDTEQSKILSGKMFDCWQKQRQFETHREAFENDRYWKFAEIDGGTFKMGGEGKYDGKPIHKVKLSPFRLGCYPVTVGQYHRFDPAHRKKELIDEFGKLENQPVVQISWFDAYIFCKWAGCRLPSEAQWEFACSSGGRYKWALGNSFDRRKYCFNKDKTCLVGNYPANELGLYDMSGNVWEWCYDWYDSDYYRKCKQEGVVENPKGPETGKYRVLRGGSWVNSSADGLRSAYRDSRDPWDWSSRWGFRCLQGSP
ncbi:MAG: SUMF1/EgtB/PvdO family nonheme iron enzyme, partial [bacterium]|nr:SUMF1/EgtB/PvdO family nonheme iron enzyme [bacterium]